MKSATDRHVSFEAHVGPTSPPPKPQGQFLEQLLAPDSYGPAIQARLHKRNEVRDEEGICPSGCEGCDEDRKCWRPPDRFPACELYGTKIVDALPGRCPLRATRPLDWLHHAQDAAWQELGRDDDQADKAGALDVLDQLLICSPCTGTNLTHPRVVRLRGRGGVR